jgi:hypothetical protein
MRSARGSAAGLETGVPSTYVRRDKTNNGPGDAEDAPGPGTEEQAFDAMETVPAVGGSRTASLGFPSAL